MLVQVIVLCAGRVAGRALPHVNEPGGQIGEAVLGLVDFLDFRPDDLTDHRDQAVLQDGRVPALRVEQQKAAFRSLVTPPG